MKKIPTLFVRDFGHASGRFVTDRLTPDCEWALDAPGLVGTRKWDGTCISVTPEHRLWARREVKPGKTSPPRFYPLETDETTGKTVGWEPAEQSPWAKLLAGFDPHQYEPGTYELLGPKVNGNPELAERHLLVPHGVAVLFGFDEPRTADDLRYAVVAALRAHPTMEGVVLWERQGDPTGRMAKLKRRDLPELA